MAGLRETETGFERVDVKLEAWPGVDRSPFVGFWRTTMPHPDAQPRRNPLVDDATLGELLIRLADVIEPEKRAFRFILALILMRKRLLSLESTSDTSEGRFWHMKLRGRDEMLSIAEVSPSEDQIANVQTMLGEILNQES